MPSDTQERLTPGQTFVDAAGQRRWKSRVPGMPNVEADAFEEEVQDTLLSAAPPSFTLEDLPATRPPSPEALTALRGLYARTGRALPETLRPTELETARAEDPFAGATPKFTLEPVSEASPARSLAQALPTAPTTADLSIEERVARALSGEAPAEAETASPLESVPLTEQQLALARARYAGRDIRGSIAPPKAQETPSAAVTTPVPFAQASPVSDQAGVKTGALPATTSSTPAPPADTAANAGLPAPQTEGAGGDVSERDLYLARLAAQSAAGFGGMGAGKSIDMGIADTLGERLKQVQALRAKREEQGLEKQKAASFASRLPALFPGLTPEQQTALRETITAGGSVEDAISLMKQFKGAQVDKEVRQRVNEQALMSAIARYPELAQSFEALRSVAGEYGEKDFASMLERAASGKAGFEAKGAATRFMVDKQGRFNQLTPGEVEKQKLQNDRLKQQIELDAKAFKIKEDEALKQTYKDDNEKATKLNELAEKEKGFGGYVTLANDLAELEAAAPGFVTRGEAPEWLTSAQQALGQNWPASTDPRVVKFLGAYGKLANAERHRLYGSAQTAGELKAFLQQLNDNPFSAGPDVLAMQMGGFAANVGRRATNTLNRYSNVFGTNIVDRVLGNEFRPLYAESGVFSSFKDPFPAASAASAGAGRPAKPEDTPGKKTLWNKKTGQWVRYTPEQEAKARAAGAVED